jgi:hypothetical protein
VPVATSLRALAKPVERIRLVVSQTARGELNHLGLIWPHARELELVPKYEFIAEEPSVILRGDHATFIQHRPKLDTEYAIKIVQALPADTLRSATLQPTPKDDPAARERLTKILSERGIELR